MRSDLVNSSSNRANIIAYDATQLIALALLLAVVLTALFSPRVHRSGTWYNLLIAGAIGCLPVALLLGHQGRPESAQLCLIQATFIVATPPLIASASLAFSTQTYLFVTCAVHQRSMKGYYRVLLLIIPYLVYLLMAAVVLVSGTTNVSDSNIAIGFACCQLSSRTTHQIVASVTLCLVVLSLIAAGFTVHALRRNWNATSLFCIQHDLKVHRMVIRFCVFSMLNLVALVMSIWILLRPSGFLKYQSGIMIAVNAIVPLSIGLIFGTQSDIFKSWFPYFTAQSKPQTLNSREKPLPPLPEKE